MQQVIQQFFTFEHQSDVIAIIFGITSGILTLVGLVSIFVSINSQHKTEKAREVHWELISFPYKFEEIKNDNVGRTLFNYFWLYNNILNSNSDFTSKVILIAKGSIVIVSGMWLIMLCFLMATFHVIEFIFVTLSIIIVIGLLSAFYWTLNKLGSDISEIGSLPNVDQLLNASNKKSSINTITLAGMTMKLKITKKSKGLLEVSVGFPMPFSEFAITPVISGKKEHFSKDDVPRLIDLKLDQELFLIEKRNYEWWLGSPLHWHKLFRFQINDDFKSITIQLDLNCSKGLTHVYYRNILVEELNDLERMDMLYLLPDDFTEMYVEAIHGPAQNDCEDD